LSQLYAFANNVKTTLAGAISSTSTTITLASSANFPTIPSGYVWAVTLNDIATQTLFEIVYVTATSGSNLTCLRGQEGTSARAWNVGDIVFAADTAGILSSFVNQTQLANTVQLNPASQQSGSINISGSASFGANVAANGNLSLGGAITNATTGNFTAQATALSFFASQPYTNYTIAGLHLGFNGGASYTGIGPSIGLSMRGITASMLAIGSVGTGALVAIDVNGNIATPGSFLGQNGLFNGEVAGTTVFQGSDQVVSTLTSSTLALTKTGGNYQINYSPTQFPVGTTFINDGNGGNPSFSIPNYGQWFIEVFYAVQETSNTNMTITLALIGGTITGGFLTNANGHTAFNAESIIMVYGKGRTTANNQTVTFALTATGGSFDPSNQPWTVRATRYN
jgi:hypothetical protein